jgi:hypothetical protein
MCGTENLMSRLNGPDSSTARKVATHMLFNVADIELHLAARLMRLFAKALGIDQEVVNFHSIAAQES